MNEKEIQIKNQKEFILAIKHGVISQLYKDGFLTEAIYRKLMLSIAFPFEKTD
ncbi:MAG: hypothetical protein K0Q87_1239 [Neobacillus sp.]|jgi:hypothetical protein|nr:hypothetical protein [Neobacillus sp.]